jgi:hypothetical protein
MKWMDLHEELSRLVVLFERDRGDFTLCGGHGG